MHTMHKPDLRPAAGVAGAEPYRVPRPAGEISLHLDSNEGIAPPASLLEWMTQLGPDVLRRYPDKRPLEELLAERFGVEPAQVLVTGGGDDALDRACRSVLSPGLEFVIPAPSFEMLDRYAALTGATAVHAPWLCGPFPRMSVLNAVSQRTAAIAVVSPNNPTGAVATRRDLLALASAAPQALLVVDLAYAEFADEDLMPTVMELPNAVAVRTFSKAWGLAGLRIGYAIGPERVINWMRAAGSPYPTAGLSVALAAERLLNDTRAMHRLVERVRHERTELYRQLLEWRARPLPSQANFVLAHFRDAHRVWMGLAERGIAVRRFPDRVGLEDALRISCPGDEAGFSRLLGALGEIKSAQPEVF